MNQLVKLSGCWIQMSAKMDEGNRTAMFVLVVQYKASLITEVEVCPLSSSFTYSREEGPLMQAHNLVPSLQGTLTARR